VPVPYVVKLLPSEDANVLTYDQFHGTIKMYLKNDYSHCEVMKYISRFQNGIRL